MAFLTSVADYWIHQIAGRAVISLCCLVEKACFWEKYVSSRTLQSASVIVTLSLSEAYEMGEGGLSCGPQDSGFTKPRNATSEFGDLKNMRS